MNRIVNTIKEIAVIKSGEISVLPGKMLNNVDLHKGVTGNGAAESKLSTSQMEDAAAAFPIDCLPGVVKEIVRGVSQVERTPGQIAACCALGAISMAIGKKLRIHSHPGKICPGNLFILSVAPSGSNKSESYKPIMAPLYKFEANEIELWKIERLPELLESQKFHAARIKAIEKQLSSKKLPENTERLRQEVKQHIEGLAEIRDELTGPRFLCENATSEALVPLLYHNGECIASLSPDARDVIDVLDGRYRNKGKTDEGLYLKAGQTRGDHWQSELVGWWIAAEVPDLHGQFSTQANRPKLSGS